MVEHDLAPKVNKVNDLGKVVSKTVLKPEMMNAAIAQLVEHDLAKVGVASSSLVCRSVVL